MHWYSTDDRHDTGEWVAPDCELCDTAVPSVGERNGAALCAQHWSRCDDCHEAEGSLDLEDGSRVCDTCAGERFDAQYSGIGHDNDEAECALIRKATR